MAHPWPLFDLRLRTPHLELRLPTDEDLLELVKVAREGVIDEGRTVFLVPWNELPSPAFERQFLLHSWGGRGSWSPDRWSLVLAAILDGQAVGMQEILATDFAIRRVVASGSWLGRRYHGHGYGIEMRAAVLSLAFGGLGADVAESGHFEGNAPSARVSEKLGYVANGRETFAVSGKPVVEHKLRVTRETWRRDLVPVTIENLEPCLKLFGVGELGHDEWVRF
jgi:RimJ/RimL family protein N-acetyltransferase